MHKNGFYSWTWRTVLSVALLSSCSGLARAELRITEAEAKQAARLKPIPEYPATARQLNITGKVQLEIAITPGGDVAEVKVVTGNPLLTKACAKVVSGWKFRPFHKDGKPTDAVAPLSFEFR